MWHYTMFSVEGGFFEILNVFKRYRSVLITVLVKLSLSLFCKSFCKSLICGSLIIHNACEVPV